MAPEHEVIAVLEDIKLELRGGAQHRAIDIAIGAIRALPPRAIDPNWRSGHG